MVGTGLAGGAGREKSGIFSREVESVNILLLLFLLCAKGVCPPIPLLFTNHSQTKKLQPLAPVFQMRKRRLRGSIYRCTHRLWIFTKGIVTKCWRYFWGIKPFTVIFYELPALNMHFYEIAKSARGIQVKQLREERPISWVELFPWLPAVQGPDDEVPVESLQGIFKAFCTSRPPEPATYLWDARGCKKKRLGQGLAWTQAPSTLGHLGLQIPKGDGRASSLFPATTQEPSPGA